MSRAGVWVLIGIAVCGAWCELLAQDLNWPIEAVDPSPPQTGIDAGDGVAVAYDPLSGAPVMAYRRYPGGQPWLAEMVGAGHGNCGTTNQWQCQELDTVVAGEVLDVAYHVGGGVYALGVVYRDAGGNRLVYWERRWDPTPPGSWQTSREVIREGSQYIQVGKHVALDFTPEGLPMVASWADGSVLLADSVRIALRIGGSSGSCGVGDAAGAWNCRVAESGAGVGLYPALTVWEDTETTIASLIYWNSQSGALRHALLNGSISSGCSGGDSGWICDTVDSGIAECAGTAVVSQGSINDIFIRVAYLHTAGTWGEVRVAEAVSSGGSCGSGGWDCYALETTGAGASGLAIDVAAEDKVVVAYRNPISGRIRIGRESVGIAVGETCGPTGSPLPFQGWTCRSAVVPAAGETIGDSLDMVVDPDGEPVVLYHSEDATSGQLRFGHYWLFRDGFESANALAWSSGGGLP